jgi:hypothetical protein
MPQENFIGECLAGDIHRDPNHPINRNRHEIIIDSLRSGRASCTCGDWNYQHTGEVYYDELFIEFIKHRMQTMKQTKNVTEDAKCVIHEESDSCDFTEERIKIV